MTPEEAIAIIAREVIAQAADDSYDCWDAHPEIGEGDWSDVADAVTARTRRIAPTVEQYDKAYAVLSARAEH